MYTVNDTGHINSLSKGSFSKDFATLLTISSDTVVQML